MQWGDKTFQFNNDIYKINITNDYISITKNGEYFATWYRHSKCLIIYSSRKIRKVSYREFKILMLTQILYACENSND